MYCLFMMVVFSFFASDVQSSEVPREVIARAEAAYLQKDFDKAFEVLSELPELLGVVPLLDQPKNKDRAEIFFDLARIRLAQNDTAQARAILDYIFVLDREARKGVLDLDTDDAYEQTRNQLAVLRKVERQRNLSSTTLMGAAGRSLVFPGWGQLYRGHRKRAFAFMGATAAAAIYWFVADKAYQTAYNAYRSTRVGELNLEGRSGTTTDAFPFRERFENAQAKASRANMALGILASVWLAGVFDHVIVGPAHLGVVVPIF
ncbi:MAG: hypothetical protein HOE48_07040 [Candidatus Latescibacteria bacterium]|nr:hypothetical protein [Candidatus Latescibacterota bacterium]MBT4137652.1 hypothetical protein [Candidatus Latescibacterota bacterium]MBT5830406.1 hypothetical protein [Candidatus Latescibacterota bacterium]